MMILPVRSANSTTIPAQKEDGLHAASDGQLLGGGYTSAGDTDVVAKSPKASAQRCG